MDRYEIRLSGAGGQGAILAGIILADAITKADKFNVAQTQSYGPEARGGASKAEVIVSEKVIAYPKVTKADFLLALTDSALKKYLPDLKKTGSLLIDEEVFIQDKDLLPKEVIKIPIFKIARDQVGKIITANMVALGAMTALFDFIDKGEIEKVIAKRVPTDTVELNLEAFSAGYRFIVE